MQCFQNTYLASLMWFLSDVWNDVYCLNLCSEACLRSIFGQAFLLQFDGKSMLIGQKRFSIPF